MNFEYSIYNFVVDNSIEVGRTDWIKGPVTYGENVVVEWPSSHFNALLQNQTLKSGSPTWKNYEAKVLKSGDDLEELNNQANALVKVVPPLPNQKYDGKSCAKAKRLRVEEDIEVIKNINADKVALEIKLDELKEENKVLREQLQERATGDLKGKECNENRFAQLLTTMETSMKKHSEYEKRIICVLSSLEKSTQDLSNAVLQLNKPRDLSSLTHHIPKLTKSLTSNSNQYSDLLNDSVELENTCDFNVTQSFHSSFQKWKAPSTSYGSSGATSHTLNSSDMSDQLNHSFSITNSNAFNDSLVSKSNLTETPVCISIPIRKEPNYPDGSSRKQLVPGHKIYIDHVKFSKCNKSHGTNRFVNDLLVSLVGSTDYLRSVSFSGKQSNAHSDKVAKPKICQDLVDGVVACACQILGVSSKDVRTAIKIKLNIASKVKKR